MGYLAICDEIEAMCAACLCILPALILDDPEAWADFAPGPCATAPIECDTRLGPVAVQTAVSQALTQLGLDSISPSQESSIEAGITDAEAQQLFSSPGLQLEEVHTESHENAYRVLLGGGWELKLYQDADGSWGLTVGHATDSLGHVIDFAQWWVGEQTGLLPPPNPDNAEEWGQFSTVTPQAQSVLEWASSCALDNQALPFPGWQ